MSCLIVVRHGETPYTRDEKVQGLSDTRLLDEGLAESSLLGKKLFTLFANRYEIDLIYSSPQLRALQTLSKLLSSFSEGGSSILSKHCQFAIEPSLRENYMGILTGKPQSNVKAIQTHYSEAMKDLRLEPNLSTDHPFHPDSNPYMVGFLKTYNIELGKTFAGHSRSETRPERKNRRLDFKDKVIESLKENRTILIVDHELKEFLPQLFKEFEGYDGIPTSSAIVIETDGVSYQDHRIIDVKDEKIKEVDYKDSQFHVDADQWIRHLESLSAVREPE